MSLDVLFQYAALSAMPRLESIEFLDAVAFSKLGQSTMRSNRLREDAFDASVLVNDEVIVYAARRSKRDLSANPVPTKFSDLVTFLYKGLCPQDPIERRMALKQIVWYQSATDPLNGLFAHNTLFAEVAKALLFTPRWSLKIIA